MAQYNFGEIEEKAQKLWDSKGIPKKTTGRIRGRKIFSFLEGPPTANAPPGLHHAEVRVFKDVVCRHRFMKGFSVPRKAGWDCHGLPVEVQVEKKLGLKSKKEVEDYGAEKFNAECRKDVFTYIEEWERLTKKLGFWVDFEGRYATLDNEYIESVWWSLKKLYEKGLLFEGHKVVPYCTRCGTPLSSHEVAQGYRKITEEAITLKFKLKGKNEFVLAWTTTPWTLPSNLALAVNPEEDYVRAECGGETIILAKKLLEKCLDGKKATVLEEFRGKNLLGMEYEPLFPYFVGKLGKKAWIVIAGDFVSMEEGTGIVHIAPAFGEDDYNACQKEGIAFVQPVDESGRFTSEVKDLEGKSVKGTDREIIELLEKGGKVFSKSRHEHDCPFCWRCESPLIYYATKSWFIRMSAMRERMRELNEKIYWNPNHVKEGRFGEWISNAKDWALSRKKYWGTPLPLWKCTKCGKYTPIGSVKELIEAGATKEQARDLHKPFIDRIKLKCAHCAGSAERVQDVIDCWYDSGSAAFAQYHYPFENRELFEESFPYSFIAEALDQTRGWFYTLHALGTVLFDSNAYKSAICAGLMVDRNGEKMSKSKGNIISPWEAFRAQGVDAVRLQFMASAPGAEKRFGIDSINEVVKPFLLILWNSFQFSRPLIGNAPQKEPVLRAEDKWIISRMNSALREVDEALEKYEFHHCTSALVGFVNEDLSRTYIKLVRDRARENDLAAAWALNYVFERLSRILAPFAPYLSEEIHSGLASKGGKESVHLEEWPEQERIDSGLEGRMEIAKQAIQAINSLREKQGIGLRWPLKAAGVISSEQEVARALQELQEPIRMLTNTKLVSVVAKETNFPSAECEIGKAFIDITPDRGLEEEGLLREITREIQNLRKKANLSPLDRIVCGITCGKETFEVVARKETELRQKVGASEIVQNPKDKSEFSSEKSLKGEKIIFGIKKV